MLLFYFSLHQTRSISVFQNNYLVKMFGFGKENVFQKSYMVKCLVLVKENLLKS